MRSWSTVRWCALATAGLIVLVPGPARAAEQAPADAATATATAVPAAQPTPAPVLSTRRPGGGSSLAAAAARIRLKRDEASGGSGLVISNDNLRESGSGGVMSVTGAAPEPTGAAGGEAPAGGSEAGAPGDAGAGDEAAGTDAPIDDAAQRYLDQKRVVDELQARLDDIDRQLAKPAPDPRYPYSDDSPYNRAPGQQDPQRLKRDELARQLDEARAKLDALRRQAAREGVALDQPPQR